VDALGRGGYRRYDESTATALDEACTLLLDEHRGDLRRIRPATTGGDTAGLEEALTGFKRIGPAGAGIFCREVQAVWPEVAPYFDDRARDEAARRGLPRDPDRLGALVDDDPGEVARLAAALVRAGLDRSRHHRPMTTAESGGKASTGGDAHARDEQQDEETPAQRLTRNWSELLQELRVTQTGIQVLTGFLLTVPFSNRFTDLTHLQRTAYLVVLAGAILSTALIMSPAAFHRVLFRHGERPWLVDTANQVARAGLAMIALTTGGVAFLAFDVVAGLAAGVIAGVLAIVVFAGLWVGIPVWQPRPGRRPAERDG
jgi:hypothetical protein